MALNGKDKMLESIQNQDNIKNFLEDISLQTKELREEVAKGIDQKTAQEKIDKKFLELDKKINSNEHLSSGQSKDEFGKDFDLVDFDDWAENKFNEFLEYNWEGEGNLKELYTKLKSATNTNDKYKISKEISDKFHTYISKFDRKLNTYLELMKASDIIDAKSDYRFKLNQLKLNIIEQDTKKDFSDKNVVKPHTGNNEVEFKPIEVYSEDEKIKLYKRDRQSLRKELREFDLRMGGLKLEEYLFLIEEGLKIDPNSYENRREFKKELDEKLKAKGPEIRNYYYDIDGLNSIYKALKEINDADYDKKLIRTLQTAIDTYKEQGMNLKDIYNNENTFDEIYILDTNSKGNLFAYLANYNFDHEVDSIGKKEKRNDKKDMGSISGLQLYNTMKAKCDLRELPDGERYIIDGPETSNTLEAIVKGSLHKITDTKSKDLLLKYLRLKNLSDNNETKKDFMEEVDGQMVYTREGFVKYMRLNNLEEVVPYFQQAANHVNEYRDAYDMFLDDRNNLVRILKEQATIEDIDVADYPQLKELIDWKQKDAMKAYRSLAYKMNYAINVITDTLCLSLGKNPRQLMINVLANVTYGGVKRTVDQLKGLNNKQIKDEFGKYVSSRASVSLVGGISNEGITDIGKEKLLPVAGLQIRLDKSFDKEIINALEDKDLANRIGGTAGLSGIFGGGTESPKFVFNIGVDAAKQINKKKIKQLEINESKSVNRIGIETGVSADVANPEDFFDVYGGVFIEKDFPAGIEQQAQYFDAMLGDIFELNYSSGEFGLKNWSGEFTKNKLENRLRDNADERLKSQEDKEIKTMTDNIISQVVNQLEQEGLFNYKMSLSDRLQICNYIFLAFVQGFHENAVTQHLYEDLAKGIKLTKVGLRFSIKDIVTGSLAGAGKGTVLGPWGSGAGAVLGAIGSTMHLRFSTFANSYEQDLEKTLSNYDKLNNGEGSIQESLSGSLSEIAQDLENKLNIPGLNVTIEGKALKISGEKALQKLNVLYSKQSLDSKSFYYSKDNFELVIGNIDKLGIQSIFDKDSKEVYLVLGQDGTGNCERLNIERNIGTKEGFKEFDETKEQKESLPINKDQVIDMIKNSTINKKVWDKDAKKWKSKKLDTPPSTHNYVVSEFNDRYKNNSNLLDNLVNGKIVARNMPDGTINFSVYKNKPEINAKNNKVEFEMRILDYVGEKQEIVYDKTIEKYTLVTPKTFNIELGNLENLSNSLNKFTKDNFEELSKIAQTNSNKTQGLLKDFLESSFDKDIIETKENLISLLETRNDLKDYEQVKVLINNVNNSDELALLITKFRDAFAVSENYTYEWLTTGSDKKITEYLNRKLSSKSYADLLDKNSDIKDIVSKHSPYVKTCIRNIQKELEEGKSNIKYETDPQNNILGFSAFYRTNATEFALTHPGDLEVVPKSITKILNDSDKKQVKKRYLEQLKDNKNQVSILLTSINKSLQSLGTNVRLNNTDDLITLIDTKEISQGDDKIAIEGDFVFYLMGECTNESIGFQIDKINIVEVETSENTIDYLSELSEYTFSGQTKPGEKKSGTPKYNIRSSVNIMNADYDMNTRQNNLTIAGQLKALFAPEQISNGDDNNTDDGPNQGSGGDDG